MITVEAPKEKERMSLDQVVELAQKTGLAADAARSQLIQKLFSPDMIERLTIVPTKRHLLHLNYLARMVDLAPNDSSFKTLLLNLYTNEINLLMSLAGVSLDKFSEIMRQQIASDITIKGESTAQQIAQPQGFWARHFGGNKQQ